MLEDLRTFFLFKVCHYYFQSHSVCASSLLSWGGGVILVSHFTNYISLLCASMEIGKPAGCVPLFVAEVNWTIGCMEFV